jgi:hypothetical protein
MEESVSGQEKKGKSNDIYVDEKGIQYKFSVLDENVCAQVFRVAIQLNTDKVYTDVYNFKLQCSICQRKFRGQKEAHDHALETTHCEFSEI